MICIYQKGNTDYTKNGDAVLNPTSAMLTMTINGAWQLTIEHPYDAEGKFEYLVEDAVVRVDVLCINELETVQQRFRIYNYVRNLHSVTAIAFPIAMESTYDAPVDNVILQNATGQQAIAALQQKTNKYTLSTDITAVASTSWANTNVNSAIAGSSDNTFLKVWGGEILYDNLKYKVRTRLGSNVAADHKVTYGNNLESIEYKKDDSGLITRIYPISKDGIRLNGTGYVDSEHISDYAVPHARYMEAPYSLISTSADDPSSTAQLTRQAISAVNSAASSLSQSVYATAKGNGYQPEYIKTIRSEIVSAVQTMALQNVISTSLYNAMASTIASAMDWMKDLKQPKWGWMGSDQSGWKYGDATSYAKNMYVKIGKTWSYFGNDGNWQEPKDSSDEWDWHDAKNGSGKQYGNFNKYFAHNEYVYITQSGTIKEYWFNEQGWFEEDESGDSDYYWHGSGTGADPYWFGSSSSDYLKSCWRFIDGTYYFFDSYGYVAAQKDNYQWDWVENGDSSRAWFGNAINSEYAADYLTSQWEKINGTWYYFDANGIVESESVSQTKAVALFTTGMASLTSTVDNWKGQLYTLLYNLMRSYCAYQYRQGVDIPSITISVNMVELSQTTEYEGYEHLETIKLGDSVQCNDYQHSISTINRVVGITYDCIYKKIATVVLGEASATVQQMVGNANGQAVAGGFDTSALETQLAALRNGKQDKLTAGDNITIENNVISAAGQEGQGLKYFKETYNSLYGKSDIDLSHNAKYYFDNIVSAQWSDMKLETISSGVMAGIFEGICIRELSNGTEDGIFIIADNPSKVGLKYTRIFESGTGTIMYADCPTDFWDYGNFNANVVGGTFNFNNKTYYIIATATSGAVWNKERDQIGTLDNVDDFITSGTIFETVSAFGYELFTNSAKEYYNGLSRNGELAFFAGATDSDASNATIKEYADGRIEIETQMDGMSADDGFILKEAMWAQWTGYTSSFGYVYRKANNKKAVMARLKGAKSSGDASRFVIASKDPEAIQWEWAECNPSRDPLTPTTEWDSYQNYPLTPEHYSTYEFGWQTTTITYEGETWYIMGIQPLYSEGEYTIRYEGNMYDYEGSIYPHSWTIAELGAYLLNIANATNYVHTLLKLASVDRVFEHSIDGEIMSYIDDDGESSFGTPIEVNPTGTATATATKIKVNGVIYDFDAGSDVTITPTLATGTKIADFEIDGQTGALYAPQGGGGTQEQADWAQTDTTAVDYIKNKPSIPEIEANPSETASETLSKLEIDGTVYGIPSGGGGSFYKMTTAEYNALPQADKTDPNKLYFIDDGGRVLDPDYTYHTALNGQIVVRVYHEGKSDEKTVWFFNGLEKTSSDLAVPSELISYLPTLTTSITSQAMSPTKNESSYNYWIGWSRSLGNSVIRTWSSGWGSTVSGTFWGVVALDEGDEQTNTYSDPYVYIEGESDTCIYYQNTKYADSSGSNLPLVVENGQLCIVWNDGN